MKKDRLFTAFFILVLIAGLSLLLYPAISDYWNAYQHSQSIKDYTQQVEHLDKGRYDELLAAAQEYNAALAAGEMSVEEREEVYNSLLDPFGNGLMGYVDIPSIGCRVPVGHGTGDDVLDDSVGHVEWSSLPVGGANTHSVLSGHRGLPTAELLTNIDHMEVGDRFFVHVLDMEMEYRVDQISVVLPDDASKLRIEQDKDYVTLLTCTPYGVNSHRLLVRGVRVNREAGEDPFIYIANEVEKVSPVHSIPVLMIFLLLLAAVGDSIGKTVKKAWKRRGRRVSREGGRHGKVTKKSL